MTQPTRNRFKIDPFFDGATAATSPGNPAADIGGTGNVAGTTTANCWTPNPAGYTDASQLMMIGERPAVAVMPSRGSNLRGTVIPRATRDGIPSGMDPHKMRGVLQIDPHIPSQAITVRLEDLTAENLAAGQAFADAELPQATSVEGHRLRGAAVFHGMVNAAVPQVSALQPATQSAVVVSAPAVTKTAAVREVSPLAAFGISAQPAQRTAAMPTGNVKTTQGGSGPPQRQVMFEIQHFGRQTARYHDVLVVGGVVVLVYHTDYTQGDPYWPPTADAQLPLAMAIAGDSLVYLVHSTGIQYAYGNAEFCILLIDKVGQQAENQE